jgi:thiol-disulfide isomerase/thioredoxin
MKAAIASLLLLTNLIAYNQGDTIDKSMASHLGLQSDKLYVIDFFASWCSSCKKELPLVSKINEDLDSNRVEIIGIDVDKDVTKGMKFQERLKSEGSLSFRVINDPQNLIISEFQPIGMPTLYYVKNRQIMKIITGAVDEIDTVVLRDIKEME